jgi:hypothetical protein
MYKYHQLLLAQIIYKAGSLRVLRPHDILGPQACFPFPALAGLPPAAGLLSGLALPPECCVLGASVFGLPSVGAVLVSPFDLPAAGEALELPFDLLPPDRSPPSFTGCSTSGLPFVVMRLGNG